MGPGASMRRCVRIVALFACAAVLGMAARRALADTDQYAGTKASFESVVPLFDPDSIMIIDDTTCAGVQQAIREALQKNPDYLHAELSGNFDMVQTKKSRLSDTANQVELRKT